MYIKKNNPVSTILHIPINTISNYKTVVYHYINTKKLIYPGFHK